MSFEDILSENLSERRGESKSEVIINTVINLLRKKKIEKGNRLASLNSLAALCSISANTVVKAYDELKLRGIIEAIFGEDVGIISYNDTELKDIIEGGITVISADFAKMGQLAADFVLQEGKSKQEIVPTEVILRSSL